MYILGIESSCDETSISVLKDGREVLSNIISSQIEIHKKYGGVVPEIASRHHIENISYVYNEALEKANITMEEIDYIAVTTHPGLIGSLLVGIIFAKGLSYRYNKPLLKMNHVFGHLYSNFIDNEIHLPAIHITVSGGHSNIYYMDENMNVTIIGETIDDAVGEAFDKIARVLELPYPGGPKIDKLASEYVANDEKDIKITIPKTEGYNFSFSGVKTQVINHINTLKMKNETIDKVSISYQVQNALIEILADKLLKAVNDYNVEHIYVAGGVSANKGLRKYLQNSEEFRNKKIYFPKLEYCTDNAAMIACSAYYYLKNKGEI